ncbi:hypothetical protein KSP40_PGU019513 [Platanthera guangdongensis]|uniref:NAB domain-containing protein n=1 Tax=Platanthera guangdongensis TaxID=2320717 RepID=A0ABR2MQ82_9ASPA
MLQRAASNAYSWWWASNIRTKQSKWLDTNVQEMEEKKEIMIKLIEVDADSFAKKAEMYYQRRPELLRLAEEMYKAYKALADRYDRISGELHKANHTLASAFPDQFHFAMQDDDEDGSPRAIDTSKFQKALHEEVPQINLRNKRQDASSALKKRHKNVSSHLTEVNAQREIDRLQKEILVLQTEKEFVKGSYERGLAKFWNIENQITDLQDQVCSLEDEYSASSIIEDDEARALMAATAIKSCEESLASLQQQRLKSGEEAGMESKRIREAKNKLKFLMGEKCLPETAENFEKDTSDKEEQPFHLKCGGPEALDLHSVCVQLKQHFQMNSATSVVDLAEKIDELVEKVITLEVTVSSQTAQIQTLRSQTDGLQKLLRGLEEEKAILVTDSNGLNVRLRQAEDELHRVQDLEKVIDHEKGIFKTHFLDACNSFNDISEKLRSPGHKNNDNITSASSSIENLKKNEVVKENEAKNEFHGKQIESNAKATNDQSHCHEASTPFVNNSSSLKDLELDDINNGPDGRQKMLIFEYTSVLQNYKDTKRRLTEMEKKNQEYHFEMIAQIQELKSGSAIKDQEIRALRRKLFSQTSEGPTTSLNEGQMVNGEENGSSAQPLAAELDSLDTEEEVELCLLEQQHSSSPIEEKFRSALDTLLDENLDFWLRFSTSYHHIQKFESSFKELQVDLDNLKNSTEGRSAPASPMHSSKQDTPPLDKKMRELHTELRVWLEQNGLLKGELQCRFASLCSIQEEIVKASRDGEGKNSKFTPYQAAKFQGELLNMQHENNKVSKELQTGLDHVNALQSEVVKALSRLRESFDISATNGYQNFRHCSTKSKVPLRTFLFGEKRKKPSIFSCISPALHRHHNQLKYGFPS